MTLQLNKYFCETCDAGPWIEGSKGSGGVEIISTHLNAGHRVVQFDDAKHGEKDNLEDSIDAMMESLENTKDSRKDERELRLEKIGLPIIQIEKYLNTQVKDDPRLIKQLLRVYFSAYTKNPINMAILAPSSDGKTHATVQVSKIFPEKDFITVGRLSPTALIHSQGIMVDEDGNSLEEKLQELDRDIIEASKAGQKERVDELKNEMREIFKTAKNLVDLTNKVLLFLDNPNPMTYEMLKPILSHDKEELLYKTTKGDGSLKVKETIIRGWPATIVCSAKNEAKNEVWPEIETRFFMTSPNSNISKYKKANQLTSQKMGLPSWSSDVYDNEEDKKWCRLHTSEIIEELKKQKDFWHPLYELMDNFFPSNQGVMMRHYKRLLSFCNVESMINAEQRPTLQFKNKDDQIVKTYIGTFQDIEAAIDTLGNLSVIPPEKLKFYDDIFMPLFDEINTVQDDLTDIQNRLVKKTGVTSEQLAEKYTNVFHKPITSKQIRESYLNILNDEGLIQYEENESNKREYLYFPTNTIAIHNLESLKSSIIANSSIKNFKRDNVIPRLKSFNQLTCNSRKTPQFFILNKKYLDLDGLISESIRQSKHDKSDKKSDNN